ncbi:G patch domain-containing protein 4-like isoform X2 [Portunus trituberculatus]|nr:G patch domain-containing protein 4-like isoform X2 [Portunus trituberculatus]
MGEQFKFQWWDHVFNKAVDNITVTKDQSGFVEVNQKQSLEVSTKRPSRNNTKSKFYGGFVKGGTLVGQAQTHELDTSDEEQEKDKSLRLSDEQLLKLCKGRTAHKGARHGLNMTAKLARVREQELLLLQEWGAADSQVQQDEVQPKKKKRKSSKNKDVQAVTCVDGSEPENCVEHTKKQKSKRKKDEGKDECAAVEDKQETYESNPVKKKKKKHKTEVTDPCTAEVYVTTTKQKKKKKKKKDCNE